MKIDTKKLTVLAMFAAISYALVYAFSIFRVPIVPAAPFLTYEPKDAIIVISGFLFGAPAVIGVSAVVSVIEMFTVSTTLYWGLLMNVISTCAFACTAAAIYRRKRSLASAVTGLAVGVVFATGIMLLWNYLVVPIYMTIPRAAVADMLIPVFLPFNLIKYGLNAGFAVLLYKPLRLALAGARLLPAPDARARKIHPGVIAVAAFVVITCVLLILAGNGII